LAFLNPLGKLARLSARRQRTCVLLGLCEQLRTQLELFAQLIRLRKLTGHGDRARTDRRSHLVEPLPREERRDLAKRWYNARTIAQIEGDLQRADIAGQRLVILALPRVDHASVADHQPDDPDITNLLGVANLLEQPLERAREI